MTTWLPVTGGWGVGGGAVLATYLPLKGTQREGHEAGCLRALCISPNTIICVSTEDSFPCCTGIFLLSLTSPGSFLGRSLA